MAALKGPKKSIQSDDRFQSFFVGRPFALPTPARSSSVASRHERGVQPQSLMPKVVTPTTAECIRALASSCESDFQPQSA